MMLRKVPSLAFPCTTDRCGCNAAMRSSSTGEVEAEVLLEVEEEEEMEVGRQKKNYGLEDAPNGQNTAEK